MKKVLLILLSVCSSLGVAGAQQPSGSNSSLPPASSQRAFVDTYCVTCHNDRLRTGELSLEKVELQNIAEGSETWEKVIRKLRTGAMPPQGAPRRPDPAAADNFVSFLEASIDRAAMAKPNPGRATVHRLNRTEYGNAIRDLLALDTDPTPLLPADDESYGFDNIADVLKTSPSLLQRYMSASWNISRLAMGNSSITADTRTYRAKPDLSQDGHIEGLPLGTRGGMIVRHNFQLDGEYDIKVRLWRATAEIIKGLEEPHQLEISVDGVRAKLVTFGGPADRDLSYENPGKSAEDVDRRLTVRVPVKAGPRTVVATFLNEGDAQNDNVLQPFLRTNLDPLGYRGLPAVDRVSITGPFKPTGAGDTPSRRQILVCRPASSADELTCAKKIIGALARRAYRRPVTDGDLQSLIEFYQRGRNEGGNFESGIEAAVQLILASPDFLFRFEPDPDSVAADAVYRIGDLQLASRLSFFLWSSIPDEELLNLASQGRLKEPVVLERQVRRMLADPRSKALVDNFAGQWLYLRNLKTINPDFETFPDFDDNLRQAMKRETELFIDSIMREDKSVMDLLNANYTFLNERLARHYGIPGIYGTDFRRVTLKEDARRGLLGQASILTVTSYPTRTSPVQRGKWILTNVLGIPPNPPPPNIPALKERSDTEGVKIDPSGTLFNGAKVDGPASLRQMLTSRPEVFVGVLTEKMLTYGLGRGVQYYDMPAVRSVVRDAARNDFRFSSIVLGIVKSAPFQMKVKSSSVQSQ